jgi:hypothetical protein
MTSTQKQCLLAFMGCLDPKEIDGMWGPKSAEATEDAQRKLGIHDDGVWGDQTDAAVREYVCSGQDLPESDSPVEDGNYITGNADFDRQLMERFKGIQYISPEEARCRCGGKYCNGFPALPDRTILELADDLRRKAGAPLHRSSFLRCPQHNANEKGVKNSKHMTGKALDFFIEGLSGNQLLAMAQADSRTSYAYIISGQYVHVDVN